MSTVQSFDDVGGNVVEDEATYMSSFPRMARRHAPLFWYKEQVSHVVESYASWLSPLRLYWPFHVVLPAPVTL